MSDLYPRSYAEADRMLHIKCDPTRRPMDSRRIGNNTWLKRREDDVIAVQYHRTDIIVWQAGRVWIYTGGWNTMSTRERLDRYLPERVRVTSTRNTMTVIVRGPSTEDDLGGWRNAVHYPATEGMSMSERDASDVRHGTQDVGRAISGFTGMPSMRGRVGPRTWTIPASAWGRSETLRRTAVYTPAPDADLTDYSDNARHLGKYASGGAYAADLERNPVDLLDRIDELIKEGATA
jgi:hypothetical protein